MASAWLDIAVDWEDPGGWNIAELLNIIIEAYNERESVTVNNNGVRGSNTMPVLTAMALDTNTDSAPFVINHNSLNEINTRLEELLTKSQNRTTALANDVEYWTVSGFLTEKGLPTDLIPVDFTCEIFDYRWITYWFYILNEMYLLHTYTWDVNVSGNYKRNPDASDDSYATAVPAFISQPYDTFGGDGGQAFSGQYGFRDNNPGQDHDIRQRRHNGTIFRTYDSDNNFYDVGLEVRLKLYIDDPIGYSMTWNYNQGHVFDITSFFYWDVNGHRFFDAEIPDIIPQIDANTLGMPVNINFTYFYWTCGDNPHGRPAFIYSTDFNDENLISYTAIV